MKLSHSLSVLIALSIAAVTVAQVADDRALIEDAAAMQAAPADNQRAQSMEDAESAARAEVVLAQARLGLVLARKALAKGDLRTAANHAREVVGVLGRAPAAVDAEEYRLQAEGILARADKAGIKPATPQDGMHEVSSPVVSDRLDAQGRVAAGIGRRYEGADTGEIDTNAGAGELSRRAQSRQTPDDWGYRPSRELIDVRGVLDRTRQQTAYAGALEEMYRADEVRMLNAADEARVIPDGDVAYADDWPERIAGRRQYEGGQIARTPSWTDAEGNEWFAAIYDVSDLIYVPPDFQIPGGFSLAEDTRNFLDRAALRDRSQIFGGYAEDLAMGLPLLRYFGGIDDFAYRGPKYSVERQQQIVAQINAFLDRESQAKIIVIPPANP